MKKAFKYQFLSFLLAGCSSGPEKKEFPVTGKWEVKYVNYDGQVMSGPGFKGTVYNFRPDGKVEGITPLGDTTIVNYERIGDTLRYLGDGFREQYKIDTISENFMKLQAYFDGLAVTMRMLRVE